MDNIINPFFKKLAIKGKNKNFHKVSDYEFDMIFESEENQISFIRAAMSKIIFELLSDCFVPNHFIKVSGIKEHTIKPLEMVPFIFSIHSFTNQDLANRLGCASEIKLKKYLIEHYLKNDSKPNLVSSEHILVFQILTQEELQYLNTLCIKIMDIIYSFFKAFNLIVTSINLEFGRNYNYEKNESFFLGDELSPFTINFFLSEDKKSQCFEVAKRLGII